MKKIYLLLMLGLPVLLRAQSHSLEKSWETDTIVAVPESVLPDASHSFLFVSLIDGGPWDADGKGGVGKLSLDGKHYTGDWITGLNAPKGLGRFGNRLYVADISNVVVIDIAKGSIIKKIAIDGANGLMATKAGLYILAKKAVLFADANKNLRTITDLPNGGDGIEPATGGDLVVSEWVGYVYYVHADGKKELLLDTHAQKKNTADIHYDAATRTLYIPEFFGKAVSAWKLQ